MSEFKGFESETVCVFVPFFNRLGTSARSSNFCLFCRFPQSFDFKFVSSFARLRVCSDFDVGIKHTLSLSVVAETLHCIMFILRHKQGIVITT